MIPASGAIIFDSQSPNSSIISPLSAAPRLSYDNAGGLNITSYTTGVSTFDRFTVDGSYGRLFGVSDSVTGVVFSVNDAAGLPIVEVESNFTDKITMGTYGTNALVVNDNKIGIGNPAPTAKLDIAETWNSNITVTGASGTGSIATITFAAQSAAIVVGSTIVVASINPSGYNGTFVVTASTTTSVSYANATTGYVTGGNIQQVFTSVKLNVTDTASNAGSNLMDLQVGGLSKFKVDKIGVITPINVYAGGSVGYALFNDSGLGLRSAAVIGWTAGNALNAQDTILARDAAGVLAQRNGTAKQVHRVYNTFLGTTANEWGGFDWLTATNTLRIGTEHGGTGTARPIEFVTGGVARWQISAAGHFLAVADATYDIGASGANRPKDIYASGMISSVGYIRSTAGYRFLQGGSYFVESANGVLKLTDSGLANFGRLQLGGTTSSFPAIKRNGTGIDIKLADDSLFTNLSCKNVIQSPGIGTTVTPASNGDLVFETTSNTSVTLKLRGSDGVVRSASLTLA